MLGVLKNSSCTELLLPEQSKELLKLSTSEAHTLASHKFTKFMSIQRNITFSSVNKGDIFSHYKIIYCRDDTLRSPVDKKKRHSDRHAVNTSIYLALGTHLIGV